MLFALLLLSSWCRGWGGEGHQLVALIAEDQLMPEAKAAIAELLGLARACRHGIYLMD